VVSNCIAKHLSVVTWLTDRTSPKAEFGVGDHIAGAVEGLIVGVTVGTISGVIHEHDDAKYNARVGPPRTWFHGVDGACQYAE